MKNRCEGQQHTNIIGDVKNYFIFKFSFIRIYLSYGLPKTQAIFESLLTHLINKGIKILLLKFYENLILKTKLKFLVYLFKYGKKILKHFNCLINLLGIFPQFFSYLL